MRICFQAAVDGNCSAVRLRHAFMSGPTTREPDTEAKPRGKGREFCFCKTWTFPWGIILTLVLKNMVC